MRSFVLLVLFAAGVAAASSCGSVSSPPSVAGAAADGALAHDLGTQAHLDRVNTSRFCGTCHPADYAEHQQNTHGRAFFDEEARLATRGFRRDDCIRCHTPRPVFETGIGMTPMQRWTNLEEGNTCISCHGRENYDYSRFVGGSECKTAFEPEVATVAHCASCHRIAGTPDQWSRAEHGKQAGRVCVDCHMPLVTRPVAIGQPPRQVRSHVFPASSNEAQLRKAYSYDVKIDGDAVAVAITNKGVGHNFPTANRQRGVESLVIVRDAEGKEVARSRLICRYPYAAEMPQHSLVLPRGSQIPSGKTTTHRVPLTVANGTVECRLYFKLYRPSDDTDPHLSRCLEERRVPFGPIAPSKDAVQPEVEIYYTPPASKLEDFTDQMGLPNVLRPAWSAEPIEVPEGKDGAELGKLAAMLESHLPEVRRLARQNLAAAWPRSSEALVAALARWSNESFNEAMKTFLAIGAPAVPALIEALGHEHLYVRCHARALLAQIELGDAKERVRAALVSALTEKNPLDRRSAAEALAVAGDGTSLAALRERLHDVDWDVVHAAAASLAQLRDRAAVPAMIDALRRSPWRETRRALAPALAALGSAAGVQPLLDDLSAADVLQRELTFEVLFAIVDQHCGYDPGAPPAERLAALARLQSWWSRNGGDAVVRAPTRVDAPTRARTWELVEKLGGGSDVDPGGDDDAISRELLSFGADAVPALVEGLTFPAGFVRKRELLCDLLGAIGSKSATPFLVAALRDPVPAVADAACRALARCGDEDTAAQIRAYEGRVPASIGADRGAGTNAPADALLAGAARTRLMLGDEDARAELVAFLSSPSESARRIAIGALQERFGEDRGYDPVGEPRERAAAAGRWQTP
ncbi:MAG: HEAT repeat domain-containing protein [Planctomycetes bacterium]|nr:HEAT repeat domain-containing protein [Planctomycetota bacterium]